MRQLKITRIFTNRESLTVDKYLSEIGKEELISVEEEVELAQRIKKGDHAALEKLTRANLRFVVSVAKQYQNQGLSLPDLINEGNLGLITAAEKFDETRGFKFISCAVWWIRQSILQALAEQTRIIRIPLNKVGSLNKIGKAVSIFEHKHERSPSPEELSNQLGFSFKKVNEALRCSRKTSSLDEPLLSGDYNNTLVDVTKSELPNSDSKLINESLSFEIERTLGTINERDAQIIKMFFGIGYMEPMTLDEISKEFGMTSERIRQIKERAILKLRNPCRSRMLRPYLG